MRAVPILLLVLGAAAGPEAISPEVRQTTLDATVQVVNESQRSVGSGTIIKNDNGAVYILTARHVVVPGEKIEVRFFSAKSHPRAESVHRAEVLAYQKGAADLAILRLRTDKPVPGVLSLCPPEKAPNEKSALVLSCGCNGETAPSLLDGKATRKLVVLPGAKEAVSLWEVEEGQQHGRSGGPLVNRQGQVIGVCSGKGDGRGYFCTPDQIRTLLKGGGLSWLGEPD